jgi:hypothetical protein
MEFIPTHVLHLDTGEEVQVMLVNTEGYTKEDCASEQPATYTITDGHWCYGTNSICGSVEVL